MIDRSTDLLTATRRVVFHHVPKTAGTSVHVELTRHFSVAETCPERFDHLDRYSYAQLDRYQLFSGHYDKYHIDLIPSPKILVTFLRDPIERILSLYYYWRSHRWGVIEDKELDGPRVAKSLNLLDFLRTDEPKTRLNIDNSLSRTFIGRQAAAPYISLRHDPKDYAAWALLNLRRYNFVGFVAHFDADMGRLRILLGLPDTSTLMLNRFGVIPIAEAGAREPIEKQERTPEIDAALMELTTVDRSFYAAALAAREELGAPLPN